MTGNRIARAILVLFFMGLLATPFVIKRMSARKEADRSKFDAKTALARHGFYLEEVSRSASILFISLPSLIRN
jgi:hypothetical protein